MDGLSFWLGGIAGLAAAAQIAAGVAGRIRTAKTRQAARLRQVRDASRYVREKARATLALKREERALIKELESLSRDIDSGEEVVTRQKSKETLLYVLDERRNVGDQAFIIAITHRNFGHLSRGAPEAVARSWAAGRRFLVWAASSKMAHAKASMRYPQDRGFTVAAPESYDGNPDEL